MRVKSKNRIRKSTKYIFIVVAVILILISASDILTKTSQDQNVGRKTKQVYSYTNKFKYDYNVNLVDNEYTEGMNFSDANIAYLTDLIKNIDLNLEYEYNGDTNSNLKYEYEVIGKTQAVYTKDGEEQKIIEKDETLVEKVTESKTTNKIKISKPITLDLKSKNTLLQDMKQKMNINFAATYTVMLKVNVKTEVSDEPIDVTTTPIVTIDLAEKTTQIKGENNIEKTEYVAKQMPTQSGKITLVLDAILIIVAIVLLKYASSAKVTNRIKNEYKHELNRLLKLCQDRIVRVNTKPETNTENTVSVKDFGEIVKLSEELFKPILCYIDDQKDEAWFSVISNNVDYRYVLKK